MSGVGERQHVGRLVDAAPEPVERADALVVVHQHGDRALHRPGDRVGGGDRRRDDLPASCASSAPRAGATSISSVEAVGLDADRVPSRGVVHGLRVSRRCERRLVVGLDDAPDQLVADDVLRR